MKTLTMIAAVMLCSCASASRDDARVTGISGDDGPREFTGRYEWTVGEKGKLDATFTPTGTPNEYKVEFRFNFNGSPHVYAGTATGDLSDGDLRGEVKSDRGKRTFRFTGETKRGRFKGTHSEVRKNGEETATGTLRLKAES